MFKKTVHIDEFLWPFAEDAAARLSYLLPDVQFVIVGRTIEMQSDQPLESDTLTKEIRYALYRSKIRHEGAANRLALFSAVFGR